MEQRGRKYHRERLSEALREELETIVEGELGDPRIGLVNVSAVELAEDGRSARVMVTVTGEDEQAEQSIEGLQAATGFIRHELVERMQIRRAPELFFYLDRSRKAESRIDELLKRTTRKKSVKG